MPEVIPIIQEAWEQDALHLTEEAQKRFKDGALQSLMRQFINKDSDEGKWLRASGFNCARKKACIKHEVEREPFSFATTTNFFFGDLFECAAVALAEAAGVPLSHTGSKQLELSTNIGPGHTDGILQWQRGPHEVCEFKSMSNYVFRLFLKAHTIQQLDDEFGYASQVSAYADAAVREGLIDEPLIRIIAIDKSSFTMVERQFLADYTLLQERSKERALIQESKSPWDLPQAFGATDGSGMLRAKCRFCPYNKPCFEAAGMRLATSMIRGRPQLIAVPKTKYPD